MPFFRHGSDLLPERRDIVVGSRACRGKKFYRVSRRRFSFWMFFFALLFLIYLSMFGIQLPFHRKFGDISVIRDARLSHFGFQGLRRPKPPKHPKYFPCKVEFEDDVDDLVEPTDHMNFTQFSLSYIDREDHPELRFGGHQTLEERENSFYAKKQTLHCGFVKGPEGSPSTGFDLDKKDEEYMKTCRVVVSSCIFGSSDCLRRPTSKKIPELTDLGNDNFPVGNNFFLHMFLPISEFSKKNVCFVMLLDEQTMSKLLSEGQVIDDSAHMGLWKIVIVRNLPYADMRRTGKVPKFLSHRLFPYARYSIWLDSKMRLHSDPMLILDYFLWRNGSEYAISNHYKRHCVWEEVLQNKRLNKYNPSAIDDQFTFYQSDGLIKFDPSDSNALLPSYVPEGSFIVRAHTPMSNLFSCLWFNEVDCFTSRDQLSFAYIYLKLRRMNPDNPFSLNMFKDCERRALAKLFRHRAAGLPPPAAP